MPKPYSKAVLVSFLLGAASCGQAAPPSAADFAAAAAADKGAFEAFDEACTGKGDLDESQPRAEKSGWAKFTPPEGSLLDSYGKMLLSGGPMDRPEVVFLRKNSNRAEIVMWEVRTLSGSNYIFNCEVVEKKVKNLDLIALGEWAKVPISERQIEDSPTYQDMEGGRFANGAGGKATAYFNSKQTSGDSLTGLIIHIVRSSFPAEGTQ